MKSIRIAAVMAALTGSIFVGSGVAASTPFPMASGNYLNNFSDMVAWPAGLGGTSTTASNWAPVVVNAVGTIPDGSRISATTATFVTGSSGGLQTNSPIGSLTLLTTGATDNTSAAAVDLLLDFTGRNAGVLGFDWTQTNNSTGNRAGSVKVYTSTDGTTWTELTAAAVSVTNNFVPVASGTKSAIALPVAFNGSATARLRFYYHNGTGGSTGSRPKIAIDNVAVTSTSPSGTPPAVTGISPLTVTTNAGSTVQFTVTSTGDAPTYLWYKETISSTNLIAFATTPTLTLTNVLAADSANYQVILTNSSGSATSDVVTLTVVDPTILTQPVNQTRLVSGNALFTVSAAGTPTLTYQWYSKPTSDNFDFSGAVAYSNAGNVSGADTSSLLITNLSGADVTNLYVVVTSGAGSVTSSVVTLTVANSAALAYWNFNGIFLNVTNPAPYSGIGTATPVNCSGFSNNISSGLDFDFNFPSAWGTASYPTNGNAANNKTAGPRFNVSTLGAKNIAITFDTRASTTANKYQRLQYTTNGVDFIDYVTSSSFSGASTYESRTYNLSGHPGVNNNTNFAFRIASEYESTATYGQTTNQYVGVSSSYATSGTLSFDIVNITADAVTNANNAPTITSFTNVVTSDTTASVVLSFTVGDVETAAGSLSVSAVSFDQNVMPNGDIALGGSGSARTLTLSPLANTLGVAPILVTVTDGNNDVTSTWFYVTVEPGNEPPTIVGLVSTNMLGGVTNTSSFVVGDDVTAVGSLIVTATSGNTTLVPNNVANLFTGGAGANRTVSVAPAVGQYGVAPISVTVDDGAKTTTSTFYVIVRPNQATLLVENFDYDTSGAIVTRSASLWQTHSGTANQMQVGSGTVTVTDAGTEDVNALLITQPISSANNSVIYSSFTMNFSALPILTNAYFAHFKQGAGSFFGRIFATTATAASGFYRIGIGNASATASPGQYPVDLSPGVTYKVVSRLNLTNGICTLWVDPVNESSTSSTDATVVSGPGFVDSYALRQSTGEGTLTLDNLQIAQNFLSAVSNIVDVAPLAVADTYTINENSKTNLLTPLGNDVLNLAEGALYIFSVSATNGTVTLAADKQSVRYTPATSFSGTSVINYTITDGFGGLSTSTITITVTPLTSEPISVTSGNGQLILSWTQSGFFLQTSTNVSGPYVTIPNAVSPYTNLIGTNAVRFYRLSN